MNGEWDFILNIVIQIATLGIFSGVAWTKLSYLDKEMVELKAEVRDFRELKQDMAVVKNQLLSMNACLHRLANRYEANETNPT